MAISLDDIHFLTMLIGHGEQTANLAREYLDTSSPAQRQARIVDLANSLATGGQQQADQARAWLTQAGIELPDDSSDSEDGGEESDDADCDCT
ncbi:uncharacterized protein (DUF305 family) [Streptomyces sp. B3I7]|uniref:hypothetical protein n=1 Tax=Streptomyces sp. B3I7 TaxID=3042269 RepID=UPI0027842767|nr:hypothetical protein [Streptomyces sp. B3I7]MDQ0809828.1 uncharacterized protein (DUF305 family) [Streptomyces sp. B3I7]